jgi:hypothetical protein
MESIEVACVACIEQNGASSRQVVVWPDQSQLKQSDLAQAS